MTKAIVFPVNNKGGVGKTSVLSDLVTVLSRTHETGVIDFDHQASLAMTLTQDSSIGNRELDYYADTRTREIILQEGTSFNFSDAMRTLTIGIEPSKTRVSVFPVGMLYHYPSAVRKLESILNEDFRDVDIIGVDLPPIPDPALVLDYSLKPVINEIKDAELFPIVVVTPEQNTMDIGLSQFSSVYRYLRSLGVPEDRIHPILMINKLRLQRTDDGIVFGFMPHDLEKLSMHGLVEDKYDDERFRDISSSLPTEFKAGGILYHVSWLPYFSHTGDDPEARFSFYFGTKPAIFHYPVLLELVQSEGYLKSEYVTSEGQIFAHQMDSVASHIAQVMQLTAKPFYTTNTTRKNIAEVQSRLGRNLEEGRRLVFERWEQEPGSESYRVWNLDEITVQEWGEKNGHYSYRIPGSALPPEVMAQILFDTASEIYPRMGQQVDSQWREDVNKRLSEGKQYDKEWTDNSAHVHNIDVNFYGYGKGDLAHWEINFRVKPSILFYQNMNSRFPLREALDIFLRNFNNVLQTYRAS